ncbi:MAG: GNAT family N-acetyltransferase [Oscillospiraceae bacterium]
MTIDPNTITIGHTLSVEDFLALRQKVGFQPLGEDQARRVLEHTAYVAAARREGRTIGVTRLLFDYGTDAYITDVIVDPAFQGHGVGKLLVADVLNYVKQNAVPGTRVACSLYANPGKERFYESLGFSTLPNDKYGHGMLVEL